MKYTLRGGSKKTYQMTAAGLVALVAIVGFALASTAQPATTSAATGCVAKQLKNGSSGSCVQYLQRMMNARKVLSPSTIAVDGDFGPQTKNKVMNLQAQERLTADGIVGPKTWQKVCYPSVTWQVKDTGTAQYDKDAMFRALSCTSL